MALTIVTELVFGADTVTMNDITGTTDATAYGVGGNAAFSDYAHYAIIRKKNVNSVADEDLTLETYNELTDTEFIAPRTVDGWHEATKLNILKWTAGTYAANIVKYYNGVIYKANTSTSNTPPHADWDIVTDLTTLEDNASVIVTVEGRVTPYNGDVYWSKQIALLSQQGMCGICEDDRLKARLDKIYRHIQSVLVADQLGNNTDGEWNALALINLGAYES